MAKGQLGPSTRLIRSRSKQHETIRTVGPPIQKGSTVLLPNAAALYDESRTTYGRGGLGVQATLMDALADLEQADGVRLFPSGLAALAGAMIAILKAGDEILVTDSIYKPTRRFCDRVLSRFGIGTCYFPPRASAADLMAMAGPATRLIVLESPGSLTFEIQDAPAIAAAARARSIFTLIDNTWAAGHFFKPLAHGIDISVQALTKYVGGHSDVFMGSAAAADPAITTALDRCVWDLGWSVGADDAYVVHRGLRTLASRMERHAHNACIVAEWLDSRPEVSQVLWPALPSFPDHHLWKRDFSGAAGLFAFILKGASAQAVEHFLDALKIFGLGFSWGGFESLALCCDPQFAVRSHSCAFDGPVIRLSIGLEDPQDLIDDLAGGFIAAAS